MKQLPRTKMLHEKCSKLHENKNSKVINLLLGGDNWRNRGLKQMMDGVLEVKKEDALKKDIPVPEFMLDPELQ